MTYTRDVGIRVGVLLKLLHCMLTAALLLLTAYTPLLQSCVMMMCHGMMCWYIVMLCNRMVFYIILVHYVSLI
jgi:hypothetical protein